MGLTKKRLGRTGLYVTEMGLGTYQITGEFGVHFDEAKRMLDFALNAGVNFIDTAQMYGYGEAEALTGQALRRHAGKTVYISDKLGYADRGVARDLELKAYRDPVSLKRMIKHSFWLLQRDHVEIFMIHEPTIKDWWGFDDQTGDAVVMSVLEELKKEGVIGGIGLGGWPSAPLAKLCDTGRFDVVLNAGGQNIFNRPMFDSELMGVCAKHDIGVIVGAVLLQGSLEDALINFKPKIAERLKNDQNPYNQLLGVKLGMLYGLCKQSGIPILDLSLRYALSFDGIHCHVSGARMEAHVRQNLEISEKGPLPKDVIEKIIEISNVTL